MCEELRSNKKGMSFCFAQSKAGSEKLDQPCIRVLPSRCLLAALANKLWSKAWDFITNFSPPMWYIAFPNKRVKGKLTTLSSGIPHLRVLYLG